MAGVIEVDGVPHCGRSYCSTMVVSRDADCLQNELASSREMVPTSSKVGRNDLTVSRPNWKSNYEIGKNVPRKDKIHFLINLMLDLKDSREAVYGALAAWVAWEQTFPLVSLKKALLSLEKDQQWHRVIQIIKWMLSKGQGTTMGIYEQLIRALEKDDRAEEAHRFWEKRIGHDFHSAPWQLCNLMISIYYRKNMLERLVKISWQEKKDNMPPGSLQSQNQSHKKGTYLHSKLIGMKASIFYIRLLTVLRNDATNYLILLLLGQVFRAATQYAKSEGLLPHILHDILLV